MARPFFSRWLRSALLAASGTLILVFASLGVNVVFGPELRAVEGVPHLISESPQAVFVQPTNLGCTDHQGRTSSHTLALKSHTQGKHDKAQAWPFVCLQNHAAGPVQCEQDEMQAPSSLVHKQPDYTLLGISMLLSPLSLLLLGICYCLLRRAERGSFHLHGELQQFEQHLDQFLVLQQQASQHKERLMQEASHDLRTRLHAVQLLAYTLQQELPADLQGRTVRLNTAISQLQQFVQEFLSFSRLQQGQLPLQCQTIHLQDVFQQLELQFEDIAMERQIDLRIRACDILLHTDPQLLERLLANLLSNALKFARRRVLLLARVRRHAIWIEVRDDGPGIPAEEQAAIFSAFYRSQQAQHTPGLGLGLAIVDRLAVKLGYQIEVISHPGRGSLMRVVMQNVEASAVEAGKGG